MRKVSASSYILMYAGLIPLFTLSISGLVDIPLNWLPVSQEVLLSSYILFVGSFMAGIYWGLHLTNQSYRPNQLAILSNILSLPLWFSFLFATHTVFLITAILFFCLILLLDIWLKTKEVLHPTYILNRMIVSTGVLSSLGISLFLAI